jgi:hypothetical protein
MGHVIEQLCVALSAWSVFTFLAVLVADWHEELFALAVRAFNSQS